MKKKRSSKLNENKGTNRKENCNENGNGHFKGTNNNKDDISSLANALVEWKVGTVVWKRGSEDISIKDKQVLFLLS